MKDALGERMKGYEVTTKYLLPKRGYTMIRIDGKAFHTYTTGLERPFDWGLVDDMDGAAKYLCANIQNAICAFVQSDEISILMCDFMKQETDPWFKNSVQKICSVSASMTTGEFNRLRILRDMENEFYDFELDFKVAEFDARVWQLPNKTEVENYLIWRQQDTVKNSISSAAQSVYSTNELKYKNGKEKQEMLFQKGINWNDYDPKLKRGRMIVKETYEKQPDVFRTRWISVAPPTFTQDRTYLNGLIPDRDVREKRVFKIFPEGVPKKMTPEETQKFVEEIAEMLKKEGRWEVDSSPPRK